MLFYNEAADISSAGQQYSPSMNCSSYSGSVWIPYNVGIESRVTYGDGGGRSTIIEWKARTVGKDPGSV